MNLTPESIRDEIRRNGYVQPIDVPRDGPPGRPTPKPATPSKPKDKANGRFQVLNTFVDESARLVSTTAQAVWLVLYRETQPNGTAKVSHNQIAERLNLSRRTSMRAVKELARHRLIQIVRLGSNDGNTPSEYRVFGGSAK